MKNLQSFFSPSKIVTYMFQKENKKFQGKMAHTIVEAVVAMVVGAVVAGAVVVGAVIAAAGVVVVAVVPGLMGQRRCQLPGLESRAGGGAGALAEGKRGPHFRQGHRPGCRC